MLYAILCYNDENAVFSWTQEEDDAVMARLDVVHQKLAREGRMGPSLRLLPTTAATSLRNSSRCIRTAHQRPRSAARRLPRAGTTSTHERTKRSQRRSSKEEECAR